MSLRLKTSNNQYVTLISAYAPTMTNPDELKESFYEELRGLLHSVPYHDKLLLLGDFNARVGNDHHIWPGVLGCHGIGSMNSNGLLLLSLCSEFDLTISNTVFQQANKHKTSWKHPRSNHWHILDYVIVRRPDVKNVHITRAMCTPEYLSDHRLIRSKVAIPFVPKKMTSRVKMPKKMDVSSLKSQSKVQEVSSKLDEHLLSHSIEGDIETSWKTMRDCIYETASDVLGFVKRKHQDWFDENDSDIQDLLDAMHTSHRIWISDKKSLAKKGAYLHAKRESQRRLRTLKETWWRQKAKELQTAADTHNAKAFYEGLKAVYGPKTSGNSPIYSSDNSELFTDRDKILKRWAEHFQSVLNHESTIDSDVIESLTQRPFVSELSGTPTQTEVKLAIKQLTNGKAPGGDGIPGEIFKLGGPVLISQLTKLFINIWITGGVPQDFKDESIVSIFKNKGSRTNCDDYRGISLLSIAGKILARVILNRINKHLVSSVYPESQCGFRAGRGTVDMVFGLRQLQEKAREHNRDLHMVFVDLAKAFDTIDRNALWKVLSKLGIPADMLSVIRSFHEGMQASVSSSGQSSDTFSVTSGTKQGCVLAPVLFALFFSVMLDYAFSDMNQGVMIQFRTSGGLFNNRRLNAKTKTRQQLLRDLLFADDAALCADSLSEMQEIVDRLSLACKAFGLTISIKKTEHLHQPKRNCQQTEGNILIDDKPLKNVKSFVYLGSIATANAVLDKEIAARIGKASSSFGKLTDRLWKDHDISLGTKISVYTAVVVKTLIHGCETWAPYKKQISHLDAFHMRCLRSICGLSWKDRVRNSDILDKCKTSGIEFFLIKSQCRWAGHVVRMDDSRIPKILLYGQLEDAPRKIGRPLLRYKDKLKANLKSLDLDVNNWESIATDRKLWRATFLPGLDRFEKARLIHHNQLAAQAKIRKTQPYEGPWFPCELCGFKSKSKGGLASHKRKHQREAEAQQELNLSCAVCGRTCKSKGGLKLHMKTHAK